MIYEMYFYRAMSLVFIHLTTNSGNREAAKYVQIWKAAAGRIRLGFPIRLSQLFPTRGFAI
jgi:hypothetical protein